VAENKAFAQKERFPYALLCDVDRRIGLAYGACDRAEAKNARRISYLIGPDGIIRQAYENVDPSHHAGNVLDAIKSGG
jgi:thioredoxin-dependent peroxiredoxin